MAVKHGTFRIDGPSLIPWANYLDDLSNQPTPKTIAAFESILLGAYTWAHANTHVVTGRLVDSLDMESKHFKSNYVSRWAGTLHIGEGVRYARYEIGDFRKGSREDWAFHPKHSDPFDDLQLHEYAMDEYIDSLWD